MLLNYCHREVVVATIWSSLGLHSNPRVREQKIVHGVRCCDSVHRDHAGGGHGETILLLRTLLVRFPFFSELCCVNQLIANEAPLSGDDMTHDAESRRYLAGSMIWNHFRPKLG